MAGNKEDLRDSSEGSRTHWRRAQLLLSSKENEWKKEAMEFIAIARKAAEEKQKSTAAQREERKAIFQEFLLKENFEQTGARGFFAIRAGGSLKTLGSGTTGSRDCRDTVALDASMDLVQKRHRMCTVTARLRFWNSDFRICPACYQKEMYSIDVVRGVVVVPGEEESLAQRAPRFGKTQFKCLKCGWNCEFQFDEEASPRFPETRHWKKLAGPKIQHTTSKSSSPSLDIPRSRRMRSILPPSKLERSRSRSASPRRCTLSDVSHTEGLRASNQGLATNLWPQETEIVNAVGPARPVIEKNCDAPNEQRPNSFGTLTSRLCSPSPLSRKRSLHPSKDSVENEDGKKTVNTHVSLKCESE